MDSEYCSADRFIEPHGGVFYAVVCTWTGLLFVILSCRLSPIPFTVQCLLTGSDNYNSHLDFTDHFYFLWQKFEQFLSLSLSVTSRLSVKGIIFFLLLILPIFLFSMQTAFKEYGLPTSYKSTTC